VKRAESSLDLVGVWGGNGGATSVAEPAEVGQCGRGVLVFELLVDGVSAVKWRWFDKGLAGIRVPALLAEVDATLLLERLGFVVRLLLFAGECVVGNGLP